MSSDPIVYRSADPQAVKAWTDACEALEDYVYRTCEILRDAGMGGYEIFRRTGWDRGIVAGIKVPEGGKAPAGWRMAQSFDRMAVPDKRRKAGKETAAKLEAYPYPGVPSRRLPGMPPFIFTGTRMLTPGVRLLENGAAVYVEWTADPEQGARGADSIDKALWARVALSAFFAEVERSEQAKTTPPEVSSA